VTELQDEEPELLFYVFQCRGCREVVLCRTVWYRDGRPDNQEVRYFPPPTSRNPPPWRHKLPNDIRLLLEELYRSLDADNLRLPMMGARALVDMLMIEMIGDIGGFSQKLKKLEEGGYISTNGCDVLNAALDVGSAAAHRGHAANESEVQFVMDIVENMLQAVYVLPEVAQRLKISTPPRRNEKSKVLRPSSEKGE
jgi:hypothetical protein